MLSDIFPLKMWHGDKVEVYICWYFAAAAAKSLQLCPTLCYPIDSSPPGSPVPGVLQARTLEWVAISFSKARKWEVKVKSLSHVRLVATPWTAAYQAPPSTGFSRQEYWSGVPLPSPADILEEGKSATFLRLFVDLCNSNVLGVNILATHFYLLERETMKNYRNLSALLKQWFSFSRILTCMSTFKEILPLHTFKHSWSFLSLCWDYIPVNHLVSLKRRGILKEFIWICHKLEF